LSNAGNAIASAAASRSWGVLLDTPVNGRVVDRGATLGHHLLKAAVADPVPAIPADRPEHNLAPEVATLEIRHDPAPNLVRAIPPDAERLCNRATAKCWPAEIIHSF
jgi:hypothetical protein